MPTKCRIVACQFPRLGYSNLCWRHHFDRWDYQFHTEDPLSEAPADPRDPAPVRPFPADLVKAFPQYFPVRSEPLPPVVDLRKKSPTELRNGER